MDTTLSDPLVGDVLDSRYRMVRLIAQGGMAKIYEAHDLRLERSVAIKVMHSTIASESDFVDRFIREAKAAAALSHPNIVSVFDQGTDKSLIYLVMELVDGHTLREILLQRGRLPAEEALETIEQVLRALSAAHDAMVVHRDVKPENVLLTSASMVKVADFGLARAMESHHTTNGVVMGTVAYVAPERIQTGESDPRSDIYSVGIMLYEMLTGAPPFTSQSAVNVAFQHVNNEVPRPSEAAPGISRSLDSLVTRATRKEPSERPANAHEMLELVHKAQAAFGGRTAVMPAVDAAMPRDDETPTQVMPAVPAQPAYPPYDPPRNPPHFGADPLEPRGHRRKSKKRMAIIAIVVALGLMAAGIGWWFGTGRTTLTPGLVNLSKAEAEERTDKVGLDLEFGPAEFSETVKEDHVIRQEPGPNAEISRGGEVRVILSKGQERYEVPALTGMSEQEATKKVEETKLKSRVIKENHPSVPTGDVIRSEPAAGEELPASGIVTLVVSKGQQKVEIPDVVGKDVTEADATLTGLGFKVSIVGDSQGKVTAQTPSKGVQGKEGDTVTLTVADKPGGDDDEDVMPSVAGMTFKQAERRLERMGLRVQKGPGSQDGVVYRQDPLPGEKIERGDTVTLWATR